jgi:mono/diheme cytochrome c family protein
MRRLNLYVLLSGVLVVSACGSSSKNDCIIDAAAAGHDGAAGSDAAAGSDGAAGSDASASDAPKDTASTDAGDAGVDQTTDGTVDAAPLSAVAMRGQYLVSILGCSGCHTPAATDAGSTPFAGRDCFAGSAAGPDCLSSANLTNDPSGIKDLSDQQVIDAFTTGVAPEKLDGGAQYLFANMPYYQFTALKSDDAKAIVAYLRAITPVSHTVHANTGKYATRPTAAEWTSVSYADLPNATAPVITTDGGADAGSADGGADAGAPADLTNGKYVAALTCVTCHTVNTAATTPPFALDEAKAYQGGKKANTTLTVAADGGADGGTTMITKEIQSANLTPDTTGLAAWTIDQIVTAIRMGKDEAGRTICSPMRPNPSMTVKDATDIASYLKGIPPKVNAITETCE